MRVDEIVAEAAEVSVILVLDLELDDEAADLRAMQLVAARLVRENRVSAVAGLDLDLERLFADLGALAVAAQALAGVVDRL